MLDSWGVPQAGRYTGDTYWEGHWDQCIEGREQMAGVEGLEGKYCAIEWTSPTVCPTIISQPTLYRLYYIIHFNCIITIHNMLCVLSTTAHDERWHCVVLTSQMYT